MEALSILNKYCSNKDLEGLILFNLGTINSKLNNTEVALQYYQACAKLKTNSRQLVKCYELIANECLKGN